MKGSRGLCFEAFVFCGHGCSERNLFFTISFSVIIFLFFFFFLFFWLWVWFFSPISWWVSFFFVNGLISLEAMFFNGLISLEAMFFEVVMDIHNCGFQGEFQGCME